METDGLLPFKQQARLFAGVVAARSGHLGLELPCGFSRDGARFGTLCMEELKSEEALGIL